VNTFELNGITYNVGDIVLLKEYISTDGKMLIREYTKDGVNISHKVESPANNETGGDNINLPNNPILDLEKKYNLLSSAMDDLILNNGGAI
jgi:hypothetical protein